MNFIWLQNILRNKGKPNQSQLGRLECEKCGWKSPFMVTDNWNTPAQH